jgi:hypothetical protein
VCVERGHDTGNFKNMGVMKDITREEIAYKSATEYTEKQVHCIQNFLLVEMSL